MKQNASADRPIARTFVDEALACGRAAGLDVDALLRELSIAPKGLDTLTPAEFARLWLALSHRMEDEFFGLGARPMRPGSTTLLGHAVHSAPTLEVALRRMLRFLRVVLDEPYGSLQIEDGLCVVSLSESSGPRSAFAYRTFFLILHGFTCWLARERIALQRVSFPCPEPKGSSDYVDFFGVPVEFKAPRAELGFPASYLARPVGRTESELKDFLRTTPETLLRGYRDAVSLKRVIVVTCLSGPPSEWPNAGVVAAKLNMSRTTLHRRLGEIGQSLNGLKSEVRRNRATTLLARTDLTTAQIAEEVGYSDERSFYRAFRQWYGVTPGTFRRSN